MVGISLTFHFYMLDKVCIVACALLIGTLLNTENNKLWMQYIGVGSTNYGTLVNGYKTRLLLIFLSFYFNF